MLFWEATGEGTEPVIEVMLSKVFSSACFDIFGFFALCCAYKPTEEKVQRQIKEKKMPGIF